mmetsp:Transcript_15947/g.20427  ORF Transcript_15947/g.20427 Transcript_15947/m.20427 type:complete len:144 (-) Transcript_15947:1493-1924(-)
MSRETYGRNLSDHSFSVLLHNPRTREEVREKNKKQKELSRFLLTQMEYDRIRKKKHRRDLDYFPTIGEGAQAGQLSFSHSKLQTCTVIDVIHDQTPSETRTSYHDYYPRAQDFVETPRMYHKVHEKLFKDEKEIEAFILEMNS